MIDLWEMKLSFRNDCACHFEMTDGLSLRNDGVVCHFEMMDDSLFERWRIDLSI